MLGLLRMAPPHTHTHTHPATLQVLAYVLYQFIVNMVLEPTSMQCFNHTLNLLKTDPRITVRLGAADDIRGGLVRAGGAQLPVPVVCLSACHWHAFSFLWLHLDVVGCCG